MLGLFRSHVVQRMNLLKCVIWLQHRLTVAQIIQPQLFDTVEYDLLTVFCNTFALCQCIFDVFSWPACCGWLQFGEKVARCSMLASFLVALLVQRCLHKLACSILQRLVAMVKTGHACIHFWRSHGSCVGAVRNLINTKNQCLALMRNKHHGGLVMTHDAPIQNSIEFIHVSLRGHQIQHADRVIRLPAMANHDLL